jgi:hypothetical protein
MGVYLGIYFILGFLFFLKIQKSIFKAGQFNSKRDVFTLQISEDFMISMLLFKRKDKPYVVLVLFVLIRAWKGVQD